MLIDKKYEEKLLKNTALIFTCRILKNKSIMSKKRLCPFEENLMPQLKVHVGLKDSADPMEREKEMKKIYGEPIHNTKQLNNYNQ